MDWGGAHEASLLTEELLAANGYWGGDSFILRGVTPGGVAHTSVDDPHTMHLLAALIGFVIYSIL